MQISNLQLSILRRMRLRTVEMGEVRTWDQRPLIGLWKRRFIKVIGYQRMRFELTDIGLEFLLSDIKMRKTPLSAGASVLVKGRRAARAKSSTGRRTNGRALTCNSPKKEASHA